MTSAAQPLMMNDIARVVISALMRRRVVASPFARPIRSPAPIPSAIATEGVVCWAKCAEVTPAKA